MSKFSPLLAAQADPARLSFPLLASPKIDGIRAIVREGAVYSRSGKLIPSERVQRVFGPLHGLDGELVCGGAAAPDVFTSTQSAVMARRGAGEITFHVFDKWNSPAPFRRRMEELGQEYASFPPGVRLLEQTLIRNGSELERFEAACLEQGFEGVMLRSPDGPYKNGRSTAREGILLKLKRFQDAEAEIIGLEELTRADGRKAGMLGALTVRNLEGGAVFSIGTGFSEAERRALWRRGAALLGGLLRYRHFAYGAQAAPRFPVYAGLRSRLDMEVSHA